MSFLLQLQNNMTDYEKAEKLTCSKESLEIRTEWDLDHSKLILSFQSLNNILSTPNY